MNKSLSVFFGCSMRGGYSKLSKDTLITIQGIIEESGCSLITKHQTESNIITKEDEITKQFIHDREYQRLLDCDFAVFEISNPSLGVGAEIADMVNLKKPVLCIYQQDLEPSISAYVLGKAGSKFSQAKIACLPYNHAGDILELIKSFIKDLT